MLPVAPTVDERTEGEDPPDPTFCDRPGETPPDFELRPEGPTTRADWRTAVHRDDAVLNSHANKEQFKAVLRTVSSLHQTALAMTPITKEDAQRVWRNIGVFADLSQITVAHFCKTPGAWFYTPMLIPWRQRQSAVDSNL